MGKMDQIGMKRGKIEEKILGKFGRNVQKNEEKAQKIPKLINARCNNCLGRFFPKNNKRKVSNKHAQGGFFSKNNKGSLTERLHSTY